MVEVASGPSEAVRSLDRAVALLTAMEKSGHPMGVSELGRATGLPNSTVQRLLYALESHGLVQKEFKRYYLGPAVVPLARAYLSTSTIAAAAQPALEQLALITGDSASLYVRDGHDRVLVQRVESPYTLRIAERIGTRLPLHLGAAGRVLLAHMPTAMIQRYLDSVGEMRLFNGDVLARESLLANLEEVRRNGFAVSRAERRAGAAAVSVPVSRDGLGVVAAVAAGSLVSRMTPERVESLVVELQKVAAEVAEACRHR